VKEITSDIKNMIRRLITREHVGFILYILIWENIIMAQEAVHSNKYIKLSKMVIKVDMTNTMYKVSHDFLCKMLKSLASQSTGYSGLKLVLIGHGSPL